jgi:DNA-binding NtrC family response regulator
MRTNVDRPTPAALTSQWQPGCSIPHMTPITSDDLVRNIVKVLLVSPFDADHHDLRQILHHSKWEQYGVRTQTEALEFLRTNPAAVVICESELPDGSWKDLLVRFAGMQHAPLLVVSSGVADDALWSEALNLGAYNVLAKPLDMKEVFHVVGLAWLSWKCQWEPAQEHASRCGRAA